MTGHGYISVWTRTIYQLHEATSDRPGVQVAHFVPLRLNLPCSGGGDALLCSPVRHRSAGIDPGTCQMPVKTALRPSLICQKSMI